MKTPDEIKKWLECCTHVTCNGCPYDEDGCATSQQIIDALEYIQQLENRWWEMFDILSSAWYGKDCYFKQDNGTVYSRASCQYLSFDQAIDEFAFALTNAYKAE